LLGSSHLSPVRTIQHQHSNSNTFASEPAQQSIARRVSLSQRLSTHRGGRAAAAAPQQQQLNCEIKTPRHLHNHHHNCSFLVPEIVASTMAVAEGTEPYKMPEQHICNLINRTCFSNVEEVWDISHKEQFAGGHKKLFYHGGERRAIR